MTKVKDAKWQARVNAHIQAHRRWCAERDTKRSQRLSLNPDDPHQAARQEHVTAYLAALQAERSRGFNVHSVRCTQQEGQREEPVDCRPLAEQLGLCIHAKGFEPAAYQRFIDALGHVLEGLPEQDRKALADRWREARPIVALLAQSERGDRSYHDPETGDFRFAWGELAHLPDRLLRAALAHEVAHALNAVRGNRPTEDAAIRLSMSWGHRPFPR
jgi:hypothetical protein